MDKQVWGKMAFSFSRVFQPVAFELGLTPNEMALLSCVYASQTYNNPKTVNIRGVNYYWMNYTSFLEKYPLTGLTTTKSVGRLVKSAVEKNVLLKYTATGTGLNRMVYLAIPADLENFLFPKEQLVDSSAETYAEWLAYKAKHGIVGKVLEIKDEGTGEDEGNDPAAPDSSEPPLLNPPSMTAPLFVDEPVSEFNDGFLAFLKKVKANTKMTIKLYKEDGGHYSVADRVELMYLSMLDGTFVEKFQPVSKKYDFSKIGPVKEEEIHKALETIPNHIQTLPECFQLWKLKTSYIMESVYVQRFGYVKPAPKPISVVDIPEDPSFDYALNMLRKCNGRNWNPDMTAISLLYQFHVYLKENHDDLLKFNTEMSSLSNYDSKVGTKGMAELGSSIGDHVSRRGIPSYEDLALHSYWWKGFYLEFYRNRGVRLYLDESLFRKQRERDNDRERLYEARPSDFS